MLHPLILFDCCKKNIDLLGIYAKVLADYILNGFCQ